MHLLSYSVQPVVAGREPIFVLQVPDELGPCGPPSVIKARRKHGGDAPALNSGQVIQELGILISNVGSAVGVLLRRCGDCADSDVGSTIGTAG